MKRNYKITSLILTASLALFLAACNTSNTTQEERKEKSFDVNIKEEKVGDKSAKIFHLKNGNGMEVELSSYGGLITKLLVPDRDGKVENVVLGYGTLEGYNTNDNYFGAAVGRFANRIDAGRFELDGETYQLATNDGDNHLHGGLEGFHRKFWDAEYVAGENSMKVKMQYTSPDGEENFPGELQTTLTFELTQDNKLLLDFEAETDKTTIVNLTHHGYFNLSGMSEDILDHALIIHAEKYTPVDDGLIPTGELKPVADTPFDFTSEHKIGERINNVPGGYDHNYIIKEQHDGNLEKMAEVYHEGSGRRLTLYADSPAVQFYSGNFLNGNVTTNNIAYNKHMGLCLEPQTFPNAPNEPSFPSAKLEPGEKYTHRIEYHFDVKE